MGLWQGWCATAAVCVCVLAANGGSGGQFDWMSSDSFDQVNDQMEAVNEENCHSKPADDLILPTQSLAQMPQFNKLLTSIIYPNRTNLLHLHNMALNRAFFFSYINQKLNESHNFYNQPGLMYHYFSAAADVSANEYGINGSAIMYDNNCSYANWYRNLPFNTTLPLFGPRAWRFDDYNEPTNWLREPTNRTLNIKDFGAGPQSNYTQDSYRINEWYTIWMPDKEEMKQYDSQRKHSYSVDIKYSNETGRFVDDEYKAMVFFGPPSPGQKEVSWLPVRYTAPYYDCGNSNKWIVSAVSPILDRLPRYLEWLHLRRFRFVASSVMDIDFLQIDINPCPIGLGNPEPNMFAGTARCKASTMCEPLYGWGFRRGGYQCMCRPGYRYPPYQFGPWQGSDIESATEKEYNAGFDCIPVQLRQVIPNIEATLNETTGNRNRVKRESVHVKNAEGLEPVVAVIVADASRQRRAIGQSTVLQRKPRFLRLVGLKEEPATPSRRRRAIVRRDPEVIADIKHKRILRPRFRRSTRVRREAFDTERHTRMLDILIHKESITASNCEQTKREHLRLPGDVSYGVEKQFSPQARVALRLAHFLSNFQQNIDLYEEYGNLRGDRLLHTEQLFGEVLANVMGDLRVHGSGLFFDNDKYTEPDGSTRQLFGPYAYRAKLEDSGGPEGEQVQTHFRAIDFGGFTKHYLDRDWFKIVKERWQSNTYGLQEFTEKPLIRSDLEGSSLKKFELYPLYYRAPREEDGWWSAPYFDCDGFIKDWIVTYSVPFFGRNTIGTAIEFKGVVIVDIKLDDLDINQCTQDFHVPNAFKNTARCHYESTHCVPLQGKSFVKGSYKCECNQGYEYPFSDRAWYFDGQTVEEEYRKKVEGYKDHRFHTLQCRIAGADRASVTWVLLAALALVTTHFI